MNAPSSDRLERSPALKERPTAPERDDRTNAQRSVRRVKIGVLGMACATLALALLFLATVVGAPSWVATPLLAVFVVGFGGGLLVTLSGGLPHA